MFDLLKFLCLHVPQVVREPHFLKTGLQNLRNFAVNPLKIWFWRSFDDTQAYL